MSGKLDQSLDEILSSQRRSARQPRPRRLAGSNKASAVSPVGGVKKHTAPPKSVARVKIPTGPGGSSGDSKVIVSNLPGDVTETQIKDYFSKTIGPVRKCIITYGPNGVSRGVATILFGRPDAASRAANKLHGVMVDHKPMKVEVVVDASRAPPPPPVKSLGDRIVPFKAQPKSAAIVKNTTKDSVRGGRDRGRGRRDRTSNRPKPKTSDELDAEMADYFDGDSGANGVASNVGQTNGGVIPAAAPAAVPVPAPTTNGIRHEGMDDGDL
ncbi:MAG: hypothetical protein M1815_004570 [Lichina confinis]|nr:MAG: hypothetical protein M1815_004570 [Lichina confinis]